MMLFVCHPKFRIHIVFSFFWELKNLEVTNKEHYSMLWYFLEWSELHDVILWFCRYINKSFAIYLILSSHSV